MIQYSPEASQTLQARPAPTTTYSATGQQQSLRKERGNAVSSLCDTFMEFMLQNVPEVPKPFGPLSVVVNLF